MKFKSIILWWIINGKDAKEPPQLKEEDKKISASMPLLRALFPGIDYYSITGFTQVMHNYAIPVIEKRFPELLTGPAEAIAPDATTEITEFLPSEGYEWQTSLSWRRKFKKLLESPEQSKPPIRSG